MPDRPRGWCGIQSFRRASADDSGVSRHAKSREKNEVEFTRIVAFSDGVFAIAITLLVLNLGVDEHLPGDDVTGALWDQRHNLLAYAISFAVIGRFWVIHHRLFGEITGFNNRLMAANLFYLAWVVLIPFSSQLLGDHGGDTGAVVVYAFNIAMVTIIGTMMSVDAQRAGLLVPESEAEIARSRRRALTAAGIFLASIPVAFVSPHVAPLLWLGLFIDPTKRRHPDPA